MSATPQPKFSWKMCGWSLLSTDKKHFMTWGAGPANKRRKRKADNLFRIGRLERRGSWLPLLLGSRCLMACRNVRQVYRQSQGLTITDPRLLPARCLLARETNRRRYYSKEQFIKAKHWPTADHSTGQRVIYKASWWTYLDRPEHYRPAFVFWDIPTGQRRHMSLQTWTGFK